jgi:hypothetical protein
MIKSNMKKQIVGAIIGFTVSAVSATIFKWRAQELIWCFWGASLGVSTIGTFILVGLSLAEDRRRNSKENNIIFGILLGLIVAGALIVFHIYYGGAMTSWFPLGSGVTKPLQIVGAVFSSYWTVILSSMFSQFISYPRRGLHKPAKESKEEDNEYGDPFLEPFRNLARLQVIIVLLIGVMKMTDSLGTEAVGIAERIVIYAVLFISFFPFIPVGRKRRG